VAAKSWVLWISTHQITASSIHPKNVGSDMYVCKPRVDAHPTQALSSQHTASTTHTSPPVHHDLSHPAALLTFDACMAAPFCPSQAHDAFTHNHLRFLTPPLIPPSHTPLTTPPPSSRRPTPLSQPPPSSHHPTPLSQPPPPTICESGSTTGSLSSSMVMGSRKSSGT
jgi:hypothetical protein